MWEWRAFAARFEPPEDGPVAEEREDVYLVAPGLGPARGLKLRGRDLLELKRLDRKGGELELWTKPFCAALEVPPHRARELARAVAAPGAPIPVRPLRSQDDVLRLLRDVGLGEPRVVVVRKTTREALLDGVVRLERSVLSLGSERVETLALEGVDEGAVRAYVARVVRPADAFVGSYPAWLAARP